MEGRMSEPKKYQRKWKNYLIFPRFQVSLLFFNTLIVIAAVLVVGYQFDKNLEVIDAMAGRFNLQNNQIFLEMMEQLKADFMMTLWLVFVSTLLLCFGFTMVFSHKVVGATHRLKQYFKEVTENGHSYDLTFREGDLDPELAEVVNEAIGKIKKDNDSPERGVS